MSVCPWRSVATPDMSSSSRSRKSCSRWSAWSGREDALPHELSSGMRQSGVHRWRARLRHSVIQGAVLAAGYFVTTTLIERRVLKWKPRAVLLTDRKLRETYPCHPLNS